MSKRKPTSNAKKERLDPEVKAEVVKAGDAGLPSTILVDLAADRGAGSETVTAKDMAIPIISILQGNSPQCKKSDPKWIEGATEGMLFNNVTNEVYGGDQGLTMLACYREKVFIEWKPKRGGFVAIHPETTPLRDQVVMKKDDPADPTSKERPTLPSGNILAETDQHYVLILRDDGTFEPAVVAMSSTALKSSRLWNTLVNRVIEKTAKGEVFNPPRWYVKYRLATKGRTKDQYSWMTWAIEPAGKLAVGADGRPAIAADLGLYQAAKALYAAVKGGKVKVKQEEQVDGAPAGHQEDDAPLV